MLNKDDKKVVSKPSCHFSGLTTKLKMQDAPLVAAYAADIYEEEIGG